MDTHNFKTKIEDFFEWKGDDVKTIYNEDPANILLDKEHRANRMLHWCEFRKVQKNFDGCPNPIKNQCLFKSRIFLICTRHTGCIEKQIEKLKDEYFVSFQEEDKRILIIFPKKECEYHIKEIKELNCNINRKCKSIPRKTKTKLVSLLNEVDWMEE